MADSVDRVFVHALNTVKKIPKTGASRPPPADRLRLYGLYKQAMEGDVDGVMERPISTKVDGEEEEGALQGEELKRERDKWDAWNSQKGTSRTEAKRKYIEALIKTMHKYASTTADARELVAELEFVWDQIKNNSNSSSGSSPRGPSYNSAQSGQFQPDPSTNEGAMRVLSPMSQNDEAERELHQRLGCTSDYYDEEENHSNGKKKIRKIGKWRKTVEHALVKMTAEIAALREQIATGREYQGRKNRSVWRWMGWFCWVLCKHVLVDCVVLALVLLWLRKRRDGRVEDLVRGLARIGREYVRNVVPVR